MTEEVAASATESLFSTAQSEPDAVEPQASSPTDQTAPAPEWHWADGMKGTGDRPEWLKEKYKSVSDQAAAYSELEKKLGAFDGAPKDGYNFEGIDGIDAAHPSFAALAETFKELNIGQKSANKIIESYISSIPTVDAEQEIKALGPQGQSIINQANQWLTNNVKDEKTIATIKSWMQTAEDIKAFDMLRSFQPASKTPTAHDMTSAVQYESLQEVKNEKYQNWQKYQDDHNYRNQLDKRMNSAVLRGQAKGS